MYQRLLNKRGFTLVELVLAIVVFSIAVSMLLLLTSKATERSADPMIQVQASGIAQAYLEEIMQKDFCDPDFDPDGDGLTECADITVGVGCTESACDAASTNTCGGPNEASGGEGTNRTIFDDVCDYTNLQDNLVRDQLDQLVNGLGQYTVTVTIDDSATAVLNNLTGNTGRALRIDVTVTHPAMQNDVVVSGYRANFQ